MALVVLLALFWLATVGGLFWGLPFSQFLFPDASFLTTLGVVNILIFIGIPVLMLILTVMRIFMRTHFKPRWAVGLWAFWILNVVSMFFVASSIVKQFSTGSTLTLDKQTGFTNADTLFVEIEENPYGDVLFRIGDELSVAGDKLISKGLNLRFEKSETGSFEIHQNNYSRGSSIEESQQLAGTIGYKYAINGNKINFPSAYVVPKGVKWRGQKPNITIKVPEGKWVKITGPNAHRVIRDVEVDRDYDFPWWNSGYVWQMGPNGMISPDYIKENQKEFSFENFNKIRLEGNIKLNIRQGDIFTVRLKDGKEHADEIVFRQDNDRLNIYAPADPAGELILLEITMPNLEVLETFSAAEIGLHDFQLAKLKILNEGEARIKAFVNVDDLEVKLSGGTELDVHGKGRLLKAVLNDNARLDAEHFTVNTADVDISNESWAIISAIDTLKQRVEDSEVISKRNPVMIKK